MKKQGKTGGVALKRNLFDFTKLINREERLPIEGIYVPCEAFEYTLINVSLLLNPLKCVQGAFNFH